MDPINIMRAPMTKKPKVIIHRGPYRSIAGPIIKASNPPRMVPTLEALTNKDLDQPKSFVIGLIKTLTVGFCIVVPANRERNIMPTIIQP